MSEDAPDALPGSPPEPPESGGGEPDLGPRTPGYGGMKWGIRRSTRPSLDTLQHDQRTMIYAGQPEREPPLQPLVDGFRSRRELINWYQAATVRTFGHLPKRMAPSDLVRDRALVESLTEPRPHADEGRKWIHARVVEAIVLPACGTAYRHLRDKSSERTSATQYSDEENWDDIDPTDEEHIGMRPAYSRLDLEQAAVLSELWGGFRSRMELSEWLHSLHPATYGTFGGADAATLLNDEFEVEMFLSDGAQPRVERERFAILMLLPAFADAARRLRAGEQSETEPDNTWRDG